MTDGGGGGRCEEKIYKKSLLSYGLFLTLIILLPSYIQKFQVYLFIFF